MEVPSSSVSRQGMQKTEVHFHCDARAGGPGEANVHRMSFLLLIKESSGSGCEILKIFA